MTKFIDTYFKELLIGVAVALAVIFAASAIKEHDARILAEQTVRQSEARVKDIAFEKAAVIKDRDTRIAQLKKQAASVKTPAQAIAAIPDVSALPLNVRPLPDAPSSVQVEAVPLFQDLNTCKQQGVFLGACKAELALDEKIITEKDTQIDALKHPHGFWKRFGKTVKVIGCAGAGGGLGATQGRQGAAIGAALGAGVCSLF